MNNWKRQRTWLLPARVGCRGAGPWLQAGRSRWSVICAQGRLRRRPACRGGGGLRAAGADPRLSRFLSVCSAPRWPANAAGSTRLWPCWPILRVPTKGPDAALIASGRGQLEMDRYRFRDAEVELKRALTLDPRRVEARRRLIMLYAQQGRSAEIAGQAAARPFR